MDKTPLLILFVLTFAFGQELSIFSKEGELDLAKITAKDTTADGYRERIGRVKARIDQVDGEIKTILADFGNSYPTLDPQKPTETPQDFENRKNAWQNEGMRQYTELQKNYETYRNNLVRTVEELEGNINALNLAKDDAAAQATLAGASSKNSGGGLGWRVLTRISAYTLAAVFAGAAAVKQFHKVDKYKGNIADLDNNLPSKDRYSQWRDMYKENADEVNKYEKQRNLYMIGAGCFAVAGTLTFLF